MDIKQLNVAETQAAILNGNTLVIDIRDEASFLAGHIPNAIQVSADEFQKLDQKLSLEQPIIMCCYHGISSQRAAMLLKQQGFRNVANLIGGYEAWKESLT